MSASGSICAWNCSDEPSARPPETITLALVSSGRSDLAISAPAKVERPLSPSPLTVSIVPLPPVAAALAKAVPRTVITSFLSLVCTVAIALPA